MGGQGFVMQGITVTFGGFDALSSVSVSVEPHEVFGVIGPNGAGKSTLLNVACGAVEPDSGQVSWAGQNLIGIRHRDQARLGIVRTSQVLAPLEKNTVVESVAQGADRRPRSPIHHGRWGRPLSPSDERAALDRARDVLRELGIAKYADEPPATVSHFVRKRAALARALVANPQLLLLDELAAGLSATEATELGGLVRKLSRRMTVVLVEHHMDLVMRACDRVAVLDSGRVIADGSPAEIQADPVVRAAYLDERPDEH